MLPTQKQFQTVARDVKKLADTLLNGETTDEEVSICKTKEIRKTFQDPSFEEPRSTDHSNMGSNNVGNEMGKLDSESITGLPLATSSPVEQSQSLEDQFNQIRKEELARESIEDKLKPSEVSLTVGVALVPSMKMAANSLCPSSLEMKKVICEVPSELRKLTKTFSRSTNDPSGTFKEHKKRRKVRAKRRFARARIHSLHERVKRIVSNMQSRSCHDVSDLEIYDSEVLQSNLSYGSFRSLQDDNTDISHGGVDVSTECAIREAMVDMQTETFIEKCDSSTQVSGELDSMPDELDEIPAHIRCFISMLKSSANAPKKNATFSTKLIQKWRLDTDFRKSLEVLSAFASLKSHDNAREITLESCESFVEIMSCLQTLQDFIRPLSSAVRLPMIGHTFNGYIFNKTFFVASQMLSKIEDQINERLMEFHNMNMESQFYCTVYYPVKRASPSDISKLISINEKILQ